MVEMVEQNILPIYGLIRRANMLYFRSCPRCKLGAVELTTDFDGPRLNCLNCGFTFMGRDRTRSHEQRQHAIPSQSLPSLMFGAATPDEAELPEPSTAMELDGPAAAAV